MPFNPTRNKGWTSKGDPKYYRKVERDGEMITVPGYPVVPVEPRDPDVWMKDNAIKLARTKEGSQNGVNHIIDIYTKNLETMKANFRLTVGRQRF